MEEYEKLCLIIKDIEHDAIKFFEKGNNTAGTRLRKAMQDIKSQAQIIRLKVLEIKGEV